MKPTRLSLTPALINAPLFISLCLTPVQVQAVVGIPADTTQPAGPDLSAQGHAEIKVPGRACSGGGNGRRHERSPGQPTLNQ